MKRFFILLFSLMLLLTGCGNPAKETQPSEQKPAEEGSSAAVIDAGKILVAYFSMPETADPENMTEEEANSTYVVNGEVYGNTQYMAMLISRLTGGDLFRIEPETAYPTDHEELLTYAKQEKVKAAFPALASSVENFDEYDTVFIGYPNWYADMPRVLYSFFETYDLAGKTIVPFVTSASGGFADTIKTITELEPEAFVTEGGLSILRDRMDQAETLVPAWLKELGYTVSQ